MLGFLDLDRVIEWLVAYEYPAMFGILVLCGLGLPLPEEVTLLGSGLLVGWGDADFLYSAIACISGILVGDSIIFGLGYVYGVRFLRSRPMRFLVNARRQRKVGRFFRRHGNKAVFFARFFAGVRVGVYAYAGSQRMSWFRFLLLDFIGALISGTVSIWIGKWAALKFAATREEAKQKAIEIANQAGHWILAAVLALIALYALIHWLLARSAQRAAQAERAAQTAGETQESKGPGSTALPSPGQAPGDAKPRDAASG